MSDKPSYLGLLNAIALGESRAHCYLSAWIEVTPSDDVRRVLATVAAREGEHGMAFAKRLNELGYGVLERDDPKSRGQPGRRRSPTAPTSRRWSCSAWGASTPATGPTSSTTSSATTPSTSAPASCSGATSPRSGTRPDSCGAATSS